MFKNIERKQIAIDERQQFFQELEEKEKANQAQNKNSNLSQFFDNDSNKMFDSKFYNSVANIKTNSQVTDSFPFEVVSRMLDSHIQNGSTLEDSKNKSKAIPLDSSFEHRSNTKQKPKMKPFKRLEDYDLQDLVEKFLVKDSSKFD